jgi:hypothetical protein
MLTKSTTAKETLYILEITRNEIETGDISGVLSRLKTLSSDRASILAAEGAVSFMVGGYDDDPRPLHAVPEVREWFQRLNVVWPYWAWFGCRTDETIGLIISFLLPGTSIADAYPQTGWEFDIDGLRPLLLLMFGHQNELLDAFGIDEELNERVSHDFVQSVMASVEVM